MLRLLRLTGRPLRGVLPEWEVLRKLVIVRAVGGMPQQGCRFDAAEAVGHKFGSALIKTKNACSRKDALATVWRVGDGWLGVSPERYLDRLLHSAWMFI